MKLPLLVFALLGLSFQAQAECPICFDYLTGLGAVLFSDNGIAFQIEYLVGIFCEDGNEQCVELVTNEWPKFLEVFFAIENLKNELCTVMGADDNCGNWEGSTSAVDTCIARAGDFIGLAENDAFEDFVDFMASEDGYCGVYCENSENPDCLEQCNASEQESIPKAVKGLLDQLELGAEGICDAIVSQ